MSSVSTSENVFRAALMGNGRIRYHTAKWISAITSPPLTGLAALIFCTAVVGWEYWHWTAVYAALAMGIPVAYIFWLYQQGIITDLDLSKREERVRPYATFVAGALLGWAFLVTIQAPELLTLFGLIVTLQAILGFCITRSWKISVHCYSAANLTIMLLLLLGAMAFPAILILFAIAWARIYLNRHTPAQTFAGICLGGLTTAVVLTIGS